MADEPSETNEIHATGATRDHCEHEEDLAHQSNVYADAVWRIRPLLDHIERWLATLPDDAGVTTAQVMPEVAAFHGTYDQVTLALYALETLAIMRRRDVGLLEEYHLDRQRLEATAAFRLGVRVGLGQAAAISRIGDVPRLVAALPRGLPADLVVALRRDADDLRAALIAVMTGARTDITLAAPFWDHETVSDLEDLLRRRLQAGVSVTILGRRPRKGTHHSLHDFAYLASSLATYSGFHAFVWQEALPEDPFGTQTFHFKAIVADSGRSSYLGTANFTLASLRSRMELGAILEGEPSLRLARLISGALSMASPFSP